MRAILASTNTTPQGAASAGAVYKTDTWEAVMPSAIAVPIAMMRPIQGTTTIETSGLSTPVVTGTATARTVATTNVHTRAERIDIQGTAAAQTPIGLRFPGLVYTTGNSGVGGFWLAFSFGPSNPATTDTHDVSFHGMRATEAAPTYYDPLNAGNVIGFGNSDGSTTLSFYYSGAGTGATKNKVDLGANFPCNTLSTDWYDCVVFAPSNPQAAGYGVAWECKRRGTTYTASGTVPFAKDGLAYPGQTVLLTFNSMKDNYSNTKARGVAYGQFIFSRIAGK